MQIEDLIWFNNFVGMFMGLLGSMAISYCFGKNQFRIKQKRLSQRIIIRATKKESWRVLNSHYELRFSVLWRSHDGFALYAVYI